MVLEIDGQTISTHSDEAGRFSWQDDASHRGKRLQYRAEKSGFESLSGSREIAEEELRLELELRPREVVVRLRVLDVEGRPLERANVTLEREGQVFGDGTAGANGVAALTVPASFANETLHYRVVLEAYETGRGSITAGAEEVASVVLQATSRPYPAPKNRFEAVRHHPDSPALGRHRPSALRWHAANLALVLVGGLFVGFGGLWIAVTSEGPFDGFRALRLVPVVIGGGVAIYGLVRFARFAVAPLRRQPALVVGERTEVSGGGGNSMARTSYFLTLEFEDGERREFETKGRVSGLVAAGDMGLAFCKGGVLVDFRRVAV